MKKGTDSAVVSQICAKHGIELKDLRAIVGSFDKQIFFINNELLLRVSETTMEGEQERFRRVAALACVPKIVHAGVLEGELGPVYYTLLTQLPGVDFVTAYSESTVAQQRQLGTDVASFLDELHTYTGTAYDVGLYIPAIPHFAGTWQAGHQKYWELLHQGRFSGVIDWECSQFGEADLELCHDIHWCLYPPRPNIDFSPHQDARKFLNFPNG